VNGWEEAQAKASRPRTRPVVLKVMARPDLFEAKAMAMIFFCPRAVLEVKGQLKTVLFRTSFVEDANA